MIEPSARSLLVMAVAAAGIAGCDLAEQRRRELDAQRALDEAKQAAGRAGAEIKREAKKGAAEATQSLEKAGEPTGQAVADAAITARVKAALHADKDIKSRGVDVETFRGKVVLKGTVPERTQADRAAQVAQSVAGVKGVENQLTVN